jgi:DNA-binding TFAR19-related protein (PDSD5 family)
MNPKKQFEKLVKNPISDRSWGRVKALMIKHNLTINKDNLQVMSTLKIESARHKISLETALIYYLKSANIQAKITGKALYEYLQELTRYAPHRTTIIRWFDGCFNPEKTYQTSELSKILLSAFLYNLRTKNYATPKKSNRTSQISINQIRH